MTGELPPSGVLAYELPRIAREAVTNAVKHGEARRIHIEVQSERHGIALTVDDDGRGLGSVGTGGFGVVGMRERAERCGGSLRSRTARRRARACASRIRGRSRRRRRRDGAARFRLR